MQRKTPVIVYGFGDFTIRLLSPRLQTRLDLYSCNFPGLDPASQVDPNGITATDLLDAIDEVADAHSLDQFVLLGFSISGTVALDYTVLRPERVAAVALICSPPVWTRELRRLQQDHQEASLPNSKKQKLDELQRDFRGRLQNVSSDRVFAEQCLAQSPLYWHRDPENEQAVFDSLRVNMDLIMAFESPMYMGHDISDRFGQIPIPVLQVFGRHDYATPPACWSLARTLPPYAHRVLFEESGHYPMIEEREHFDDELLKWLQTDVDYIRSARTNSSRGPSS